MKSRGALLWIILCFGFSEISFAAEEQNKVKFDLSQYPDSFFEEVEQQLQAITSNMIINPFKIYGSRYFITHILNNPDSPLPSNFSPPTPHTPHTPHTPSDIGILMMAGHADHQSPLHILCPKALALIMIMYIISDPTTDPDLSSF